MGANFGPCPAPRLNVPGTALASSRLGEFPQSAAGDHAARRAIAQEARDRVTDHLDRDGAEIVGDAAQARECACQAQKTAHQRWRLALRAVAGLRAGVSRVEERRT